MPGFPKNYDFKKIEVEISSYWGREKVEARTTKVDPSRKLFSFLEGPPTANAPPGLHHVQSRFYKDLVCRFNYMKGFSVPRKGGWDCHGLPVEVQVEKKLGLKTKKEVLDYGIAKFNKLCREDVFTFIKDWDAMTKRMAFWIDLENAYVTMTNPYIESVWWSLKELYRKNLLYEDHKVVPYCPRCETPLSSHEVALGYNDVSEDSVTTKFRLKGENRFMLAWTTTPWTTPANIGLAVGNDIVYAVVEQGGEQYIVAKDAVPRYFPDNPVIIGEFTGDKLVGKEYVPLFDYFAGKLDRPAWRVIAADFVNTEEGTGIVHQAPAFGEEDYDAIKKAGMAFVQPVDESGRFTKDVPDFEGVFVKDADPGIIKRLEKDNLVFSVSRYAHSYPFCWRCDTPLLYYALKSWFVRVTAAKEKLIEYNRRINWYPGHIKDGRFGDWLSNVKDWALSRNKFWGTPLPIWKCEKCAASTVIGSVAELEAAADKKLDGLDLHKPAIDEVTFKCTECSAVMRRVPYVIDTWYDSGSASFAQLHYPFENRELFSNLFPYSFITESIDQTRGWFYTLHVLGTLLFDSHAYGNVVVGGLLVDANGEKMSKSRGNTLNPMEVFDAVGVDAVRLQLCTSSPDNTKRFGYELMRENVSPFLNTLWNVCVFADSVISSGSDSVSKLCLEDKWIISRSNGLVKTFTEEFDSNNFHRCFEEVKWFVVEDLSRWYVRLVRGRDDDAVADTLEYVIDVLVRLLAPFVPYLSEFVNLNLLRRRESIHFADWPAPETVDESLERRMSLAREVTQAILSVREKIQRGVRWPVKEAVIVSNDGEMQNVLAGMSAIISGQANVMKLVLRPDFKEAKTRIKPDYSKLGPLFGDVTPAIIAQLSMKSQDMMMSKLGSNGSFELAVDGRTYVLSKDHFIYTTELPEKYDFAKFSSGAVYVDKDITPEMEAVGLFREVLRFIQQSRKDAGLSREQPVDMAVRVDSEKLKVLQPFEGELREKVNASSFSVSEASPFDANFKLASAHSIKGSRVEVFIKKR